MKLSPTTARTRAGAALAAFLLLVACSTRIAGKGTPGAAGTTASASSTPASSSATTAAPSSSPVGACPSSYLTPDPQRPRVTLTFAVADDLRTVEGTEHISFTPDLPITELVFRLTANTAPTVAEGNKIVVRTAKADNGAGAATYTRDGAASGTQGGLLHVPFGTQVAAGTTVTADLTFVLTLGNESFDRFGRTGSGNGRFAWFASAHPLLAWERGHGWHTEPMLRFTAESATSEAMQTDLTVTAPATQTVIMSGDPQGGVTSDGTKTWHSTIDAARDVSVAVGPFSVSDTTVGSVKLRVGAYDSSTRDQLVPEFQRAIAQLSRRFGPYPFPSLSVARLPSQGGGIEYPSSILMLDGSRLVAVHETAHQWFYAMVGDAQATHPWLDEAFASYAEQLVNDDAPPSSTLDEPGRVDRPIADYGSDEGGYYHITYDKGAAALHAARAAAGAAKFDAAIRCYVNANAWRVANPPDLATALKGLPQAIAVLRKAQALR